MFSFGSKKPAVSSRFKPANAAGPKSLAQFGFLDMGIGADIGPDPGDEDDEDLEAELNALTQGGKKNQNKKVRKQLVSEQELAAMVSSSLADIPSDGEVSDVDDADVEDELNELCGEPEEEEEANQKPVLQSQISLDMEAKQNLLQERLAMYELAERNANLGGDTMKAKRFGRGVKTLRDMIKQIKTGKAIVIEDVPPPLAESTKSASSFITPNSSAISNAANEIMTPSSVLDNNAPVVGPVDSLKPLIPTRVAPQIPITTPLPPVPPRTIVPKPEPLPSAAQESAASIPQTAVVSQVSAEVAFAIERRNEIKTAALQAKRSGDQAAALQYVRLVKMCDQLISSSQQGQPVDWSQLPPSLNAVITPPAIVQPHIIVGTIEPEPLIIKKEGENPIVSAEEPVNVPQEFVVPEPRTTLEALEQRLAKYQSSMQQAQDEGNSSKARRLGRIVKQYQDSIKFCKAGKPVPFDELPDPPGYPPIPGAPRKAEDAENPLVSSNPAPLQPSNAAPGFKTPALSPPTAGPAQAPSVSPKAPPKKTALATRQDKQLAMLLERQNMFKQAALEAKKAGEIAQAKEYLRMAKGIDPLISANKCGVPVDMDTLPIPPQMKQNSLAKGSIKKPEAQSSDDFVILSSEECALVPSLGQETSALLIQLEADLVAQLKMCSGNREHYKLMGDVANANRFDQLALHTRKDLDVVRGSVMRGDAIPRWKHEMRTFSIVKCCTDLKDDDMEITVLRGLSYNVPNPKTIDTYVKIEVPLPNTETPTSKKTNTIKDTSCPEYNESFYVNFSRQSRTLLRIFKAKNIKFEVWAKGGFLRSDVLIGTASLKLAELLNHCQVHEAIDIMDGRKPVGGKLEVKVRLRDPIVGKEVEQVQEKWTVLIH